jgi:hypothetical protein
LNTDQRFHPPRLQSAFVIASIVAPRFQRNCVMHPLHGEGGAASSTTEPVLND